MPLHLVWHTNDLRIFDHPALSLAAQQKEPVCGFYIDEDIEGSAMQSWKLGALQDLQNYYRKLSSSLLYFDKSSNKGPDLKELFSNIAKEAIAQFDGLHIYTLDSHEPKKKAHIEVLQKHFSEQTGDCKGRVKLTVVKGARLISGQELTNNQGLPIRVFTPFYKRFLQSIHIRSLEKPVTELRGLELVGFFEKAAHALDKKIKSRSKAPWEKRILKHFTPTREAGVKTLSSFKSLVSDYQHDRNDPTKRTTSKLSPYLALGLISPHEVYHFFKKGRSENNQELDSGPFIRQIIWREFAAYLLDHFPQIEKEPFSEKFKRFPWKENEGHLTAWQKGLTGYPLVDAGMRELWQTGWMHNRLRMVVGSFLVKDLLISWEEGAKWFWETLIDADLANNTFGWQWVGGMGPDAAPFFRIFNPILQSQKFDPEGLYIKKYIPELAKLDNKQIHAPWLCSKEVLEGAGIELGRTYPFPIVDHAEASKEAKRVFGAQ